MRRRRTDSDTRSWTLDQLAKSEFFRQKVHEWGLLTTASKIEQVRGEDLDWNLETLGITERAWSRMIHRGIKPVVVFAHPAVLITIPDAVGYYRMLAMVSQKSMNRVGLPVQRYELGRGYPDETTALLIARHLNQIISRLVEMEERIDSRGLDLWRGMAAGSQAQGSWQNAKGDQVEALVKSIVQKRLHEKLLVPEETSPAVRMSLIDGRVMAFGDEPDVAIYRANRIEAAMEIKGGIDPAGVLERLGAAIKSLRRVKEANPNAVTILLVRQVSLTERAKQDLEMHRDTVNRWFAIEDFVDSEPVREEIFTLLGI